MLEKEFQYYLDNQKELVAQHNGKFVVIKGTEVLGVYGSSVEALTETSKSHERGTFLIQQCLPGENNYSHTFYSRVLIAAK